MASELDRRQFLFGAGAGAAALARPFQAAPYTLQDTSRGKVLRTGDRVALEYLMTRPAGLTSESACCFHPLNTPSGERLTDLAPRDHTTHRGLFLAWHAMEFRTPEPLRADFWGWGRYAPTAGRVITNRDIRLVRADAASAEIEIQNEWTIEGRKVLDEQTSATCRDVTGARVLDLVYRLTPDVEATIERQAFGGLCLRARNDGRSWFSNANGRVDLPNSSAGNPDLNWPVADWYAYSIALDGGGTIGGAVIDHPSNPRSTWHIPRSVHFLQPAIMAAAPVAMPRSRTLTLRYRVVTFDGEVPTRLVDALAAEWRR